MFCFFIIVVFFFFFFKQKTAYEMRISDWSSDVCSSDLNEEQERRADIEDADVGVVDDGDEVPAGGRLPDLLQPVELAGRPRRPVRQLGHFRLSRYAASARRSAPAICLNDGMPLPGFKCWLSAIQPAKIGRAHV